MCLGATKHTHFVPIASRHLIWCLGGPRHPYLVPGSHWAPKKMVICGSWAPNKGIPDSGAQHNVIGGGTLGAKEGTLGPRDPNNRVWGPQDAK
jgi:hypothetical protein